MLPKVLNLDKVMAKFTSKEVAHKKQAETGKVPVARDTILMTIERK